MNALDPFRQALRPLIPRGFLRRDQGNGLLISDYPRYGDASAVSSRVEEAGFQVTVADGLARIVPDWTATAALLDAAPVCQPAPTDENLFLYSLARRIAEADAPLIPETEKAVWTALKYLDAVDMPGLYRFLSPAAALAQRQRHPLPGGLGRMILRYMSELRVKS